MGSNHDLKDRFKKLQLKEPNGSGVVVDNKIMAAEATKLELNLSSNAHIHQAIANCDDSNVYDWKKVFRKDFPRPAIDEASEPVLQQTQWNIQALMEAPVLISFHYSSCLPKILGRFNTYLTSRPSFWTQVMYGAGQIHIRSAKNKLQLWIRSDDVSVSGHKNMKAVLENEFLSNSKQLKAFNIQKIEEWYEISFDITEKSADIRDKEASV